MLTTLATRFLERRGHVVLEPDFLVAEDVFANVGPFTVVRRDAPYKVIPAATRIVHPGEIVVSAQSAGMPEPGSVWTPSKHEVTTDTRTVCRCVGAYVFYDGGKSCTLSTWERWVRRTGARA